MSVAVRYKIRIVDVMSFDMLLSLVSEDDHMWSRFLIGVLFAQTTLAFVSYLYDGWETALIVFSGIGYVVFLSELKTVPILLVPMTATILCFAMLVAVNRRKSKNASIITGVVPIVIFFAMAEGLTVISMQVKLRDIDDEVCQFDARSFTAAAYEIFNNSILFWNPSHSHHAHVALSGQRVMIWSYREMDFVLGEPELHPLRWVAEDCRRLFSEP